MTPAFAVGDLVRAPYPPHAPRTGHYIGRVGVVHQFDDAEEPIYEVWGPGDDRPLHVYGEDALTPVDYPALAPGQVWRTTSGKRLRVRTVLPCGLAARCDHLDGSPPPRGAYILHGFCEMETGEEAR